MSTISQSNNKRIVKNTLFLYFRMFIMTIISLYTSRVVLKALGVMDFGVYNVVGGIVAMMGLLNSTMSASTQRYLNYELGKGENNFMQLRKTFCMCFNIYLLLSLIFFVIAETVGLWFLNTQLIIPNNRIVAANWVFQFSVLSVINTLLVNPYNAVIIAHERMNLYAYISILEAFLKLIIVFLLYISPIDKLISYGFMILIVSILITMIYRIYCIRQYKESHYYLVKDKYLFKELISYSGWNLFGAAAGLVKGQGLNILLNIFFNPSINAARGIAYQINTHITMFFTNFYTAVRPQITKYYAQGDLDNMFKLVFRSSKLACYLIFVVALPIVIEAPFIVNLWLGQLPEYVVPFVRLIVVISAVDSMAAPIMTTAHATGKIALYQSIVGTMVILNIPISYCLLKFFYCSPLVVFEVSLCIAITCLFLRLWIVKILIDFPVKKYIIKVFGTVLVVLILSICLPIWLYLKLDNSLLSTVIVCFTCVICTLSSIFIVGLEQNERKMLIDVIKKRIFKV